MTINTEVSNNLENSSDLIVVISTQNGIVATGTDCSIDMFKKSNSILNKKFS